MDKLSRIIKLLAQGLKPLQVASIVGCTPAYLSQLHKDQGFKERLEGELALAALSDTVKEDEYLQNKYLAAEHALLDSLTANATLMEPRDQIRALEVVSTRALKVRTPATPQSITQNNQVNLYLPAHSLSLPEVTLNSEREIVAIDNKPMAPLSSEAVKGLFKELKESTLHGPDF